MIWPIEIPCDKACCRHSKPACSKAISARCKPYQEYLQQVAGAKAVLEKLILDRTYDDTFQTFMEEMLKELEEK
jgi:hypothetical protein